MKCEAVKAERDGSVLTYMTEREDADNEAIRAQNAPQNKKNMNKPRIYISLPITGQPLEAAKLKATRAAETIRRAGGIPVNPFDITHPSETYAQHMGRDIAALLACHAAYFLQGWTQSRGCMLERQAARVYDIPSLFLASAVKRFVADFGTDGATADPTAEAARQAVRDEFPCMAAGVPCVSYASCRFGTGDKPSAALECSADTFAAAFAAGAKWKESQLNTTEP